MLDIKTLLPELKKLVTDLSEDLLARSTAKNDPYSAKVDTGLREAYAQIEKGGRTADAFEVWREDYLDQVAVAWVLGCVFVRFMEDNHLIDECWLAGEGERRKLAEDTHELYFRAHPHDSDREYFEHVFHEVGKIPACRDLFAEGKTPLWAVGPSGDMAMKLLGFWRDVVPETGGLQRSFEVEDGDTRFLGDLYQDLSDAAQKKYALKQTPVFVEEFILDRTLSPAIDEFGLDEVRMIDPTCGSGHFLLGSFARLFDLWIKREDNEVVAAQKALDGVWGCDINPFAVAIARFRLIVAALRVCGIKRLKGAPAWNIHLATGDSLLFGSRWNREGKRVFEQRFLGTEEESWAPEIYACEDKEAVSEVLGQQYHAVVGNPPYITGKDKALNDAYRSRYKSCYKQFSLGVPFTERFFDLALCRDSCPSGYVGMITANSFMKREFGSRIIETFIPHIELTHVIDTSGAYIPGHGTPTVILFGRNRKPQQQTVRGVLGIRGEPETPDDPAQGKVWNSITTQIDAAGLQDAFTSTEDVPRDYFSTHPWSLTGGGAREMMEELRSQCQTTLDSLIDVLGYICMTRADDVYLTEDSCLARKGIPQGNRITVVAGNTIRDWQIEGTETALFPYDAQLNPVEDSAANSVIRYLWPYRTDLWLRREPNGDHREIGLTWYEWSRFQKQRFMNPKAIAFAEIASHNHFVFDEGGKVFNQTAPIIKLPAEASEDVYFSLLGYLSSSVICFWMKETCHQKQMTGGDGVRIESRAKVPYQFAGTALKKMPIHPQLANSDIPSGLRSRLALCAKRLTECSKQLASLNAENTISRWIRTNFATAFDDVWDEVLLERQRIRSAMVLAQEEIDYCVYAMFGIVDESLLSDSDTSQILDCDAGKRAFEIYQGYNEDGFATASQIPEEWPVSTRELWHRRIDAISACRQLKLFEDPHYKRRWVGRQGLFNQSARQDEIESACREWLLWRIESQWVATSDQQPELTTCSAISDRLSGDDEFMRIAGLYRGREGFDVSALVEQLVNGESVPHLPVLRYKATGIRKRRLWEKVWESQRKEDESGQDSQIKPPPKYSQDDFQSATYFRLRGPFDTPKERWISFPHCETESDPSLVVGWAGWNHLQQATAMIAYYDARKREGWDAKRLTPLLAGLDQLLPWIHQWHPEIDPEFGETAGQSFETMLKADAHELGLTLEDIRAWEPPKKSTTRRKRKTN
ncbi:BREX-2 system adenine-specific DNA-methyltransferase PglX [Bremerella sp. JC817]|uniref:BREX-2 system adenine-specific DNA-methyltransferase PglX n=1 Tax=Bremerella sp. JC817 TaxID=3231756 RepID=UPI00345B2101